MADGTGIEWTDATWNPVVGCSIVSPGCTNCYAMKVAHALVRRFDSAKYQGLTREVNGNPVWTGAVRLNDRALEQPRRWRKGRRIFVNSMSDLFHEALGDSDIDAVFAVMREAEHHTFQVLTKRADRMRDYVNGLRSRVAWSRWPLPNVWLGVSVEDQARADERIPHLLATPAAVRFLSCEPLLGLVDLENLALPAAWPRCDCAEHAPALNALSASVYCEGCCEGPEALDLGRIDWVIAGGESGPKARPMHPDWARSLRDQCATAGVPFFFKQWGEWREQSEVSSEGPSRYWRVWHDGRWQTSDEAPRDVIGRHDSAWVARVGKKAAGRMLDGRTHDEFPA